MDSPLVYMQNAPGDILAFGLDSLTQVGDPTCQCCHLSLVIYLRRQLLELLRQRLLLAFHLAAPPLIFDQQHDSRQVGFSQSLHLMLQRSN